MTGDTTQVWLWEFFNPGRLWALLILPVLIIAYIFLLRLKRNRGMRYTQTGIVGAVLPRQSQWRRHVSVAMALCSLVAIGGAWARPAGTEKVPRERATIVLALDLSQSMQATDIDPDRLDASKQAAKDFIAQLPASYNVALVAVSGNSRVLAQPTNDRGSITRYIDALELEDGTNIGDAIVASLDAIAHAPGEEGEDPAPGMIILLSDGGNTGGETDPNQAAASAKEQEVPINTIAFGTMNGYVDLDGQRFNVAPDTELLSSIASESGGTAVDAKSAGDLNDAYDQMNSDVTYEDVKKEVTARWALYALAFAFVASLGAVSMAARWP
ncbi:VWA domain-containing protein [Propionimicrobium sp. PCR01-08-3]|uniref:VWA domain-containing protein n=1 Tax=Propionimicrobium sp. PCR01-08-3 TaxID=3052086 RepID=UPI00255CF71A|nr:VWA domain-containing protein [Propionimicrobium sp. PCR01-08-3]WIY83698.1 VWA domain-containing protein [Propionimicrobium sp. PCR01-08-3]